MLFFWFLLNACVATQLSLDPLPSSSMPNLALIAKSDPRAFVEMLSGADPKQIDKIVKLLQQLVDEGIKERKNLKKKVSDAEESVTAAKLVYDLAVAKQGTAQAKYDDAVKVENKDRGSWQEAKKELDEEKPGLDNEISVFKKVLNILGNLLKAQPQDKALLELGSSTQGKLYQQLIIKVQADPTKLNQVIELVEKLLKISKSELALLVKTLNDTKADLDKATDARTAAFGKLTMAKAVTSAALAVLNSAKGALEERRKDYNNRNPILDSEEKTLKEVIRMLKKMKSDQESGNSTSDQ